MMQPHNEKAALSASRFSATISQASLFSTSLFSASSCSKVAFSILEHLTNSNADPRGRTSRFGDMHAMKGPYSSERSVALMIARELIKEIVKRDTQSQSPVTGSSYYTISYELPRLITTASHVSSFFLRDHS